MEVVGCKTEPGSCTLRPGPGAMLFHGISGDHIQGIMEEMERRSKTESRLAKGMQLNGRDSVRIPSYSVFYFILKNPIQIIFPVARPEAVISFDLYIF